MSACLAATVKIPVQPATSRGGHEMIFQRTKVAAAVGCALGAGMIAGTAGTAVAQDVRVEVTGSNIKRVESEGALPVQVITRAEIEREGIQTAEALIGRLSASSSIGGLGS